MIKKISILIVSTLFSFVIAEVIVRALGYQSGAIHKYEGFEEVDSLILYDNYITDDFGNYILSPIARDSLIKYYDYKSNQVKNINIENRISPTDNFIAVIEDYNKLYYNSNCEDQFSCYVRRLKSKKETLSNVDSSVLAYTLKPFNKHGFKSIDFKQYNSSKPKVLLIGDSFTWGMSADPITANFADYLLTKNYIIYNTGIISTDPAQYASIYEKYHGLLKPDITIINVYEGNDLMNFHRTPKRDEPHEHITNAGFFESNPQGKYLDAKAAYEFYLSKNKIPSTNWINKLCSKTAFSSILWTLTLGRNKSFYGSGLSFEERANISNHYLSKIDSMAKSSGHLTLFTLIPDTRSPQNKHQKRIKGTPSVVKNLFNGIDYHHPDNLLITDYGEPEDFHFNNNGMEKYANFLDSLIIHYLPHN